MLSIRLVVVLVPKARQNTGLPQQNAPMFFCFFFPGHVLGLGGAHVGTSWAGPDAKPRFLVPSHPVVAATNHLRAGLLPMRSLRPQLPPMPAVALVLGTYIGTHTEYTLYRKAGCFSMQDAYRILGSLRFSDSP
jgi:hypothetical protein